MSLDNRVAVVTGGSSGIGRGIVKRLAEDGVKTVVADVRAEPKQGEYFQTDVTIPTHELVREEYGTPSHYVETDVADEAAVERLVETTLNRFERLDFLVNNAGIQVLNGTQDLSTADWERILAVNLSGCFHTAKHAIPALVASDQGRVVNISSVTARFGGAGPAYAATKAGIVNLTRDLAVELAPDEVTVNAVLPGVVKTPIQDQNDEETLERQAARTALPRTGTPRDIANAVRFLVSEDAEWITGTDLVVDGGFLAGGY